MARKFKRVVDIGTQVFAVHKNYVDKKIHGARIKVCRVKSFQNVAGEIQPILTEVGNSRHEISIDTHYTYTNIDAAIEAIDIPPYPVEL